jgi:UDP:flavonoid glycosyltransferase YjiC (YdhE family)
LNLVAVDPLFCPSRHAWPQHNQVSGFLNFTEDADNWDLPTDLQAFLAQGAPPVYMTFGSVQQARPDWSMDLFLKAVTLSGCRAIIQTGLPRYPLGAQAEQIYFIGKHPHQPVFQHCAAVVHHGGAGTTHAATRSGCPSVVIPFMDEQLFWAKQLQSLQLAGKPLPSERVTAEALAQGLRTILENGQFRRNAQQAGIRMQNTAGARQAVELIASRFPH